MLGSLLIKRVTPYGQQKRINIKLNGLQHVGGNALTVIWYYYRF